MRLLVDFDDAADGLRAEPQSRGTPDHLDFVARQWIDWHEVVFAEIGCAIGPGPVLLDAHAVDVEAAYDRSAGCARRKARTCYARLFEEKIAEGRGAVAA